MCVYNDCEEGLVLLGQGVLTGKPNDRKILMVMISIIIAIYYIL
jgi:hypothetical protein